MRKHRWNWSRILAVFILAVLLVAVGLMHQRLTDLTNQIAYLQDSTNIILSDMSGLETNIAQTLKAETGLVEDYSIKITDMNFAAGTYDVAISVIPKEYTDSTKLSVFFGTRECALEKNGYEYAGRATLPLEENFGGNLTFLFADGKKKNTEVYSNYDGVQNKLDQVLSGMSEGEPKYGDGVLSFSGEVSYTLDGVGLYEFEAIELVLQLDEQELDAQELNAQESGAQELYSASGVTGTTGTASPMLSCQPEMPGELRVFLRAVSTEGYRFEYTLFRCKMIQEQEAEPAESEEKALVLDAESFDRTPVYEVYDRRGGKLVLLGN